jgi:uncharacterized protein YndB with AHSA1/START domain
MKNFSVRVSIRSTQELIWALLTDASLYTRWNNTVEKVEGKIALGESVTVRPKMNPGRTFPVKVTVFESPRRMVWTGRMPLGLFKGERTFSHTGFERAYRLLDARRIFGPHGSFDLPLCPKPAARVRRIRKGFKTCR